MLRIMAGMYQQDSFSFFPSSGMCKAGFAGFTPRYVFPLVVGRPAAGSAPWLVWTRGTFMQLAGFTGDDTSCAVFFLLSAGPCCRASWSSWTGLFVARLRNDTPHGPDSADVCVRAVLEQGW